MEDSELSGIGHLDLSVSDAEASAAKYVRVLGLRRLRRADFPRRTMVVLVHEPSGLVIGLNQHQGFPGEPFDERRAGFDHVGVSVERRKDLDDWQVRLEALAVEQSPVADTEVGSALVFRDPDHIQLELWWSRPRMSPVATRGTHIGGLIERSSPDGIAETIQRLVDTATSSGVTVFATIDHAAGARSVSLDMPETRVLIIGNPAAGTPAMLAAPDLALELPTRLLVRGASPGTPGSTVVFNDPTVLGNKYGLGPEEVAGLAGIAKLVDRALGTVPRG
jgi:uncharacterized protein (DUF302 family)